MKETQQTRILLVGEDERLVRAVSTQLTDFCYEVVCAPDGGQAMKVLCRERIDLMLLEDASADGEGCQLCQRIRKEGGFSGPVIFVSAQESGAAVRDAFLSGADDYLVKPVRADVLAARIEANLERVRNAGPKSDRQWFRQFMIDRSRREVYRVVEGRLKERIPLSPLEYGVLEALTRHREEVTLYRDLYREVWQQEDLGDVRALMVHISNLRKKVDADHTEMILAVRGVGYLFQDM